MFYLIPCGVIPFYFTSSPLDICKGTKGLSLVVGNISKSRFKCGKEREDSKKTSNLHLDFWEMCYEADS